MNELPPLDELAREIDDDPKVFALRFAELLADVRDMRGDMRKGMWMAFTVLVGLVADLGLRLTATSPEQAAEAVGHAVTAFLT